MFNTKTPLRINSFIIGVVSVEMTFNWCICPLKRLYCVCGRIKWQRDSCIFLRRKGNTRLKKMLQNIKNEQGYSEDFMKGEIENLKSLAVYIKQDIRPLLH